jgi:hypothetical protein
MTTETNTGIINKMMHSTVGAGTDKKKDDCVCTPDESCQFHSANVDDAECDFTLIDKEDRDHPAFEAFQIEMSGRDYGWEALNDAWYFFKTGWDALLYETGGE